LTRSNLIPAMVEHFETDRIVTYGEEVRRQLFDQVDAAVTPDTPVVVISVRSGVASRRAAKSHTGAFMSDNRVLQAACDATGALLGIGTWRRQTPNRRDSRCWRPAPSSRHAWPGNSPPARALRIPSMPLASTTSTGFSTS
jgi:hypothetical protein